MRRLILVASTIASLAAAVAAGPLGAASAAPYVYGCTPASIWGATADYEVDFSIYNGSSAPAHLTHKILASDGTILNSGTSLSYYNNLPLTEVLAATHTSRFEWGTYTDNAHTHAASVRLVSDVPVSAMLQQNVSTVAQAQLVPCTPQQP
jgi:hypothetical protein